MAYGFNYSLYDNVPWSWIWCGSVDISVLSFFVGAVASLVLLVSVPLGYLSGLVWSLPAFFIYVALKLDVIIKTVWCIKRLLSGKWMKEVDPRPMW